MSIFFSQHKKRNRLYTMFFDDAQSEKGKTLKDLVQLGEKLMRKAKLHPHFFLDNSLLATAQYLAFYALQYPQDYHKTMVYAKAPIKPEDIIKIVTLFEKRIAERIPVEYITQEANYAGHTFYVNEDVLVPRSIMSTRFEDFLKDLKWENYRVLDLCTGSGCIGITLALLNSKISVDLLDISEKALAVAQINIDRYALNDRVQCLQSDLFEQVKGQYDLIISNPPYVSIKEYQASPAEFKKEPKIALEAGKEGLDLIHKILSTAKNYLNPNGKLILEVGVTAAKRLKKHYPKTAFQWLKYRKPNGKVSFFALDCILIMLRLRAGNQNRADDG